MLLWVVVHSQAPRQAGLGCRGAVLLQSPTLFRFPDGITLMVSIAPLVFSPCIRGLQGTV